MKRQATDCKKIFVNHISNKGLISKHISIYVGIKTSNKLYENYPIFLNELNNWIDSSPR